MENLLDGDYGDLDGTRFDQFEGTLMIPDDNMSSFRFHKLLL